MSVNELPEWIIKLACRILGLQKGRRYIIVLTLMNGWQDWTVQDGGKVESD